jgi:hypothetical protein
LLFGAETEKTAAVIGREPEGGRQVALGAAGAAGSSSAESDQRPPAAEKSKGHGRNGADDYPGATRVSVPHESQPRRRSPTARVCSPRAWWPRVTGAASRCSSAADGTRARTCRRCCVGGQRTCHRRSKCAMPCRAIALGSCERSWPTAWRTRAASSSM